MSFCLQDHQFFLFSRFFLCVARPWDISSSMHKAAHFGEVGYTVVDWVVEEKWSILKISDICELTKAHLALDSPEPIEYWKQGLEAFNEFRTFPPRYKEVSVFCIFVVRPTTITLRLTESEKLRDTTISQRPSCFSSMKLESAAVKARIGARRMTVSMSPRDVNAHRNAVDSDGFARIGTFRSIKSIGTWSSARPEPKVSEFSPRDPSRRASTSRNTSESLSIRPRKIRGCYQCRYQKITRRIIIWWMSTEEWRLMRQDMEMWRDIWITRVNRMLEVSMWRYW